MYTIFFTINCVEQLTIFKTFVNQLQCEQLLIFCLKVKLLKNNFQYTYSRWVSIFEQLSLFDKLLDMCQPVVIFVLTAFFELLQFEQLNISLLNNFHSRLKKNIFSKQCHFKNRSQNDLFSKDWTFLFKIIFEETTSQVWRNVIWSNNLSQIVSSNRKCLLT
jgi:hypothetical protein